MPPKKAIVKSGNAGNSSKSAKVQDPSQSTSAAEPLFPPGFKHPLSLLSERCQKLGWEKPHVETRNRGRDGYSFIVTLSKINSKTSQKDSVKMEPHPPYCRPTAIEARHWGATYALYRFCNGIQLNRVLPEGPRAYWNELAVEHRSTPEHLKWMYNADPFAALEEVHERQEKAAKRREEVNEPDRSRPPKPTASSEFSHMPEVKMAGDLRELVEDAIKKGAEMFPDAADDINPSVILEDDIPKVKEQLGHLDFTPPQIRDVITFLSHPSPLASNLLGSCSPLEACVEYLILHVPECDLPERFLPTNNSSNAFITGVHSGSDNIKTRWMQDKATKEAGWPVHVVKECIAGSPSQSWDNLLVELGRKLIGDELIRDSADQDDTPYEIDLDEFEALGGQFEGNKKDHLVIPMFSAPIQLHAMVSEENRYPRRTYAPFYITSPSVPAYVRLHLLSRLLVTMNSDDFISPEEGLWMSILRVLEAEWALIEDNGPPNMAAVMRHMMPSQGASIPLDRPVKTTRGNKQTRKSGSRNNDRRDDAQIKQDFKAIRESARYADILSKREKLPAFAARDEFLEKLEKNSAVIVVGETGKYTLCCGKTTQLPQFILDSLIQSNRGSKTSIIVTQPRRISAVSVAARVSYERLDDGSVGYAIRGESKQTEKTKLLFCTTGVVLRRLSSGDSLQNVSHIVVDEVHERSVDGDFLLLELKELLKDHPTLKVILMSATINHETFVKYFNNAPLLMIPGFTHPVVDKYLEDIVSATRYRPQAMKLAKKDSVSEEKSRQDLKSQGLDDSTVMSILNIMRSDRVDYQLIGVTVQHIISTAEKRGGILIFLPGVNEIRQCMDAVRDSVGYQNADIFPLHANLSTEEQNRVFEKSAKWKVIAATNVAETSITIDDVIYVIDAGKVKEIRYDPEVQLSCLVETWVTLAAARQRRGRAGRTQPGVCYKLYTRRQESSMAKFPVPEILRVPLDSLSLTVKATREEEDVKEFLSRAIDPPDMIAMDSAWSTLIELGAVNPSGKLTPLGRHMSMLPVDLRLAKMLILGSVFQCLGPILTIAGMLSSKPLFLSPMDKRTEAARARAQFSTGSSDLLTDCKAFDEYMKKKGEGKSYGALRSFCEENFISASAIRDVANLRHDFISSLTDLGFIPMKSTPASQELNINSGNMNLVRAVILGGLWPRVARVYLPNNAIKFDKVQSGTVQRQNTAKEFKMFDLKEGRVFLHPASMLFENYVWKSPFLVYFHKHLTSKVFLRDATEVPLYALLLFGGPLTINHVMGGITIGNKESFLRLRAWPRIGILANHLRRLLDAQLEQSIEQGTALNMSSDNPVIMAILSLLTNDGLSV